MPGAVVVAAGVDPGAGAVMTDVGAGVAPCVGISIRCVVGACPGPGKIVGDEAPGAAFAAEDKGAPTAMAQS